MARIGDDSLDDHMKHVGDSDSKSGHVSGALALIKLTGALAIVWKKGPALISWSPVAWSPFVTLDLIAVLSAIRRNQCLALM